MSSLPTTFLPEPCPVCDLNMLYRMPGDWTNEGASAPLACANPACDSNHPRP